MKKIYIFLFFCFIQAAFLKAFATDDAGIVSIDSVSHRCAGQNDVYVVLKNFGLNTISSVYIDWTVNGVPETSYQFLSSLDPGDSVQVLIGNYNFVTGSVYDFVAWTREPNGQTDTDNSNDSMNVSGVSPQMEGTYTIGGLNPNFNTFTDAVQALVNLGICSSVDFMVRNGTYNEQVSIPEIQGSSALNVISFQSEFADSSLVTLTFPSATALTDNYTLQLNGVDHITFNWLTFERSGSGTASTVVEVTNQSDFVTFSGNQFVGPSAITTANTDGSRSGIYSPLTDNNNEMVIRGNYFIDNANGMWVNGDATSHATGLLIENNVFSNFYVGVFILYQEAPIVEGNIFTRNILTSTVDYYGISVRFTIGNSIIRKNKITSHTGNYGIRLRDCVGGGGAGGMVVNNFVQVGGTGISRGISLEDNSANHFIYHNSVHAMGTNVSTSRAFNVDGVSTAGLHTVNNIFSNSGGGYSYYVSDNAQAGIVVSNYNCLHSTGSVGYWSGQLQNLSDFQLASSLDGNSVSGDPLFTSMNDLHAAAGIIADAGTPLPSVPDDIDGETRDALTPDIGADEFMFTSVSRPGLKSGLVIYPNPAHDKLRVLIPDQEIEEANLRLTDLRGSVVREQTVSISNAAIGVDVSALPNGFYFLEIRNPSVSYQTTFVKYSR